ncbi:hypothetical protein [Lysinibacillus contaminans]|nr:hypothetical protein [Lysinibacillus contaminans]
MNHVLQCENCERPAPIISKKHVRTIVGNETEKKTVPNVMRVRVGRLNLS